jgi:hypothetical protein
MRPVQYSEELSVTKLPENLNFAMMTLILMHIMGREEGGNFDCDPTFEASSSLYEPHLLTQEDLNENVRDLNLSEKQAELLGYRLKIVCTKILKYVFVKIAKMNSKKFSLEKKVWSCVMMFAELYKLLDTNTIQLSGVCLLTLQKLA